MKQQQRRLIAGLIIRMVFTVTIIAWTSAMIYSQSKTSPLIPINEPRVKEIELWLSESPSGYGDPCDNRKIWDKLLKSGKYDKFLKEMENFKFPPFSKEEYFSLSDGSASSSGPGLTMMRNRAKGLAQVTWAECLENKGKYTKAVEDGLRDILNQKSWVSPRIDYDFKNYNGIEYSVELTSSLYAHTIAQTLYMMGSKLSPELRKDAIDALYKRVFDPALNKIKTQNHEPENSFLEATNNWNHVCLAGLVGAALTIIKDRHERAVFTYIGEYYSQNGLTGFGDDGYCSEGMGYYNYGFGHYILLRESILQATGGKLDLFTNPKVKRIAMYPPDIEIINGVVPAISDSHPGAKPEKSIMNYVSRNFRLGLTEYDTLTFEGRTEDNRNCVMMVFPNSASIVDLKSDNTGQEPLIRSFFDQRGVLISRPLPNSSCRMGVAMKGGNNQENHNHNDVGSYTIVMDDEIFVGDPGAIPYTANIFDAKYRYTYKTVGSYGHPVPLVGGKEQQPGAEAKAKVIQTNFTDNKDEFVLDIASAYDLPGLKTLERSFNYSRTGKGSLTVTDSFSCIKPVTFETAISTRIKWTKLSDSSIMLEGKKGKMKVSFDSPGNNLSLKSETITEGGVPYSRIGIFLKKPTVMGQIFVNYTPVN
jgi:hypothetical protein